MTRLTCQMIENVPDSMRLRDERLRHDLGIDMKGLSFLSLGLEESDLNLHGFTVAAVPITSGKGVTKGFCQSVCAITRHLGMKSFVTEGTDVVGFNQAMECGADIVFMADDIEFVAVNYEREAQCGQYPVHRSWILLGAEEGHGRGQGKGCAGHWRGKGGQPCHRTPCR